MKDDLQQYLEQRLVDPKFQAVWDESRLEYMVARQLIQLRREQGLTQSQLARRLHTQQSEISRIEAGDQNISLGKLEKLVAALGARVSIVIEPALTHRP
ncbi:MAG: helix-turn-helix domain-containing protein [Sulfobacillus sp.]